MNNVRITSQVMTTGIQVIIDVSSFFNFHSAGKYDSFRLNKHKPRRAPHTSAVLYRWAIWVR